jgi:hypothetical protein
LKTITISPRFVMPSMDVVLRGTAVKITDSRYINFILFLHFPQLIFNSSGPQMHCSKTKP